MWRVGCMRGVTGVSSVRVCVGGVAVGLETTTAPSSPPHAPWGGGGERVPLHAPSLPSPSPPGKERTMGERGGEGGLGLGSWARAAAAPQAPPFPPTPQKLPMIPYCGAPGAPLAHAERQKGVVEC